MSKPAKPLKNPPMRVRQRWQVRAGKWRVWWEPKETLRALGMKVVELDGARPAWSIKQADRLNLEAAERVRESQPQHIKMFEGPQVLPKAGTVAALIREYMRSPAWHQLKPDTQIGYRNAYRIIQEKWGSHKVASLTKPIIYNWYEALYSQRTPSSAKALITRLSGLISYGEKKGYCEGNPALRLGMYALPPRKRVASWPEIDALLEAAAPWPSMACAIALAVYHGQRRKDIVEAERKDVAGNMWRLVRSKRGNLGSFALHPEAIPYIEAAMQGHEDQERLLISEATGRPYTLDGFSKAWVRVRALAVMEMPELADFQFRDFRRTAAHLARMGGASIRDVGDMLGNSVYTDAQLSGTYMPANHESASASVHAIKRPEEAKQRKAK